ncbi:MAG: hypothetical protein J6M18_04320 [Actinomycetaceae bacterium]|nr:hypothetical protein [Actinomycetaceae bacterium]
MPHKDVIGEAFAQAFRDAVGESGMTLVEVIDALADRGVKLTQATLSYWQSGRSLPRRQSSIKAVSELEMVLGVLPGTLLAPLEKDRDELAASESAGAVVARTSVAPEVLWGAPRNLDPFLIDWNNEVQRKFIHQTITISQGGHHAATSVEGIVRVVGVEKPTMHIEISWGPGDTIPEVTNVEGGILGEAHIAEKERYALVPIYLPDNVHAGELHQISYSIDAVSSDRITKTWQRWFAWPMDMHALTVNFGEELPQIVEWVNVQTRAKGASSERIETSRELSLIDGMCQATLENVEDGVSFIRWRW